MKDVVGSTLEEVRMIKAIQRSVGALENGWIGNQTLSDIAAKLGADCWPLNVELYGQPAILARDIEPVNMSGPLPRNAISGSFSWQGQPCSILVRSGKVVRGMSCHYPRPESVLYKIPAARCALPACPRRRRWAASCGRSAGLACLTAMTPRRRALRAHTPTCCARPTTPPSATRAGCSTASTAAA